MFFILIYFLIKIVAINIMDKLKTNSKIKETQILAESKFFTEFKSSEVIEDFPAPEGPEIIIKNPPLTVIIYNIKTKKITMEFKDFQHVEFPHMNHKRIHFLRNHLVFFQATLVINHQHLMVWLHDSLYLENSMMPL